MVENFLPLAMVSVPPRTLPSCGLSLARPPGFVPCHSLAIRAARRPSCNATPAFRPSIPSILKTLNAGQASVVQVLESQAPFLKSSDWFALLEGLGKQNTWTLTLEVGPCQFLEGAGSSVPRNGLRVHIESHLRAGLSDVAPDGTGEVWCGLCGDGGGWCTCGSCMGSGGFPTRPGLAGVKGKVGWARCKTCFGQTVVPCLFCGISEAKEWKLWLEQARRHPHRSHKQY